MQTTSTTEPARWPDTSRALPILRALATADIDNIEAQTTCFAYSRSRALTCNLKPMAEASEAAESALAIQTRLIERTHNREYRRTWPCLYGIMSEVHAARLK